MDNSGRSGVTCCCGRVSIEEGTNVATIVLCVIYTICAMGGEMDYTEILCTVNVCACLLVIYAQKARKPWLFMPCLIFGALEVIICLIKVYVYHGCVFETLGLSVYDEKLIRIFSPSGCINLLANYALSILLNVWLYSIIFRGFLAVKKAESGRARPPV